MINLTKKKKGFTLIELMAVIAIIAVLAAVLVPTVSGYIDRSKKTAIITQVRNVVNAVESYDATAPTDKKIGGLQGANSPTAEQLVGKATSTNLNVAAFIKQELINEDDISDLHKGVTFETLKAINTDENAINNIYKSNGSFYYNSTSTDSNAKQIGK